MPRPPARCREHSVRGTNLRPWSQGDDNGLCGLFATVNAVGDARGPQDTSPSEALASKRGHMAMRKWLIWAAALVVAGATATATATATAAENLTSARTELAPIGNLRVGILVGSLGPSTFYTVSDS